MPQKIATDESKRPHTTRNITHGAVNLLRNLGYASLHEFHLPTGHRIDIAGVNKRGDFIFIEVKSCREDFVTDHKWHHYIQYCHQIFFAVTIDFPVAILPKQAGIIIADQFDGEIISSPPKNSLHAARHRKLLIDFAHQAANRAATHSFS